MFANYLNVTTSLVSKWERGERRKGVGIGWTQLSRLAAPSSDYYSWILSGLHGSILYSNSGTS